MRHANVCHAELKLSAGASAGLLVLPSYSTHEAPCHGRLAAGAFSQCSSGRARAGACSGDEPACVAVCQSCRHGPSRTAAAVAARGRSCRMVAAACGPSRIACMSYVVSCALHVVCCKLAGELWLCNGTVLAPERDSPSEVSRQSFRKTGSGQARQAQHCCNSGATETTCRRQRATDTMPHPPGNLPQTTRSTLATMGQHSRQHAACNGRHGNNMQRSDDSRSFLERSAASAPRGTQRLVGSEPADQEWVRPGLCMGIKRTLSCIARQVLARPEQRWAQSRCRCGADVAGARPSRGADVGRVSPVPAQTWQG
jgi:hypothetical protein